MTRIDLAASRWWFVAFAVVAFLMALLAGIVDRPWAAFGFAYALIAFGYLTLLAWLDQSAQRPKAPGWGVAPADPPTAVEDPSTSQPGSP